MGWSLEYGMAVCYGLVLVLAMNREERRVMRALGKYALCRTVQRLCSSKHMVFSPIFFFLFWYVGE